MWIRHYLRASATLETRQRVCSAHLPPADASRHNKQLILVGLFILGLLGGCADQTTFVALHWNRGTPFWEDQGDFIEYTVWEQIDSGVPWTDAKKFLLIAPIVLCVERFPLVIARSLYPMRIACTRAFFPSQWQVLGYLSYDVI